MNHFGPTNEPSTFQGLMISLFNPFDVVLISNKYWEKHVKNGGMVLQLLEE